MNIFWSKLQDFIKKELAMSAFKSDTARAKLALQEAIRRIEKHEMGLQQSTKKQTANR